MNRKKIVSVALMVVAVGSVSGLAAMHPREARHTVVEGINFLHTNRVTDYVHSHREQLLANSEKASMGLLAFLGGIVARATWKKVRHKQPFFQGGALPAAVSDALNMQEIETSIQVEAQAPAPTIETTPRPPVSTTEEELDREAMLNQRYKKAHEKAVAIREKIKNDRLLAVVDEAQATVAKATAAQEEADYAWLNAREAREYADGELSAAHQLLVEELAKLARYLEILPQDQWKSFEHYTKHFHLIPQEVA